LGRLGAAVRAARRRLGLTQGALAAASGLSRQTVVQVEADSYPDLGIRKLARLLGVLGLEFSVEPCGIAPVRGASAGSRLARVLTTAALTRRARALALAQATLRLLAARGIRARVVGSLAKGGFRADSDVDFLIEGRGRVPPRDVIGIIESAMKGFPFDVIFSDRADPKLLALIREEARHGSSAIRAA
jgi:transcriptional regulator with XRE-family HTH domain